jgi:hypothetical protein
MTNETKKLIEQVAAQAPKEFIRVKRRRNYLASAMLVILILSCLFEGYHGPLQNVCGLAIVEIFSILVLAIVLRENWKCPVCYEIPGSVWNNPKFCSACGAKLED